ENQYFCPACDSKQDATRVIRLNQLPPVLSIQLLRYQYDSTTWQRTKLRVPIDIERSLSMGRYV
ncbi:unnamed protein product, partial [Phaeothamnion confervicola]